MIEKPVTCEMRSHGVRSLDRVMLVQGQKAHFKQIGEGNGEILKTRGDLVWMGWAIAKRTSKKEWRAWEDEQAMMRGETDKKKEGKMEAEFSNWASIIVEIVVGVIAAGVCACYRWSRKKKKLQKKRPVNTGVGDQRVPSPASVENGELPSYEAGG